jgi:nucleoside-diphosphate-sugar epimerase
MSDDQGVTSLPIISRNNAGHYAWGTGCSFSRAERQFGFRAVTRLEDGLKETVDWYLGSGSGRNTS